MPDRDPFVKSYHDLPRVQQFHRALGGYIEFYSQGVASMRHGIEAFLAPTEVQVTRGNPLYHILFAGMTAKPIADAFFGMATSAAGLDSDESAVRNILRREWDGHTSFRNDLAHAEWSVGWEDVSTGAPVPPASIRIKNVDGVPTLSDLGIDTNIIITEINSLIPLVDKVRAFARSCRAKQQGEASTIMSWFDVVEPGHGKPRRIELRRD